MAAGFMVALVAIPGAALAQSSRSDQDPEVASQYADGQLDELTPTDQYKTDDAEAENVLIGEWYTENGIAFSWHEEAGMSRTVFPDDWNDEAHEVIAEYNENHVYEEYPASDIAAVNAEVDAIVAALADAGIASEATFDEEGFKALTLDIAPDAAAIWDQANDVIAGMEL